MQKDRKRRCGKNSEIDRKRNEVFDKKLARTSEQ